MLLQKAPTLSQHILKKAAACAENVEYVQRVSVTDKIRDKHWLFRCAIVDASVEKSVWGNHQHIFKNWSDWACRHFAFWIKEVRRIIYHNLRAGCIVKIKLKQDG